MFKINNKYYTFDTTKKINSFKKVDMKVFKKNNKFYFWHFFTSKKDVFFEKIIKKGNFLNKWALIILDF